MGVTVSDLKVVNASPADLAALSHALNYIQGYMPVNGAPVIQELARTPGVTIIINHSQQNSYDYASGELRWDPSTALVVVDDNGNKIGANSAATVFLHEATHAIDKDGLKNLQVENKRWGNDTERYASQVVNSAAAEVGEIERVSHYSGGYMNVINATEHTQIHDDGLQWTQIDVASFEFDWGPVIEAPNMEQTLSQPDAPILDGGEGSWLKPINPKDILPHSVTPSPSQAESQNAVVHDEDAALALAYATGTWSRPQLNEARAEFATPDLHTDVALVGTMTGWEAPYWA
jgi:hypothetical protein